MTSQAVGGGPFKDVQGYYNAVSTVTETQRAIHEGKAFGLSQDGTIAANSSAYILGATGAKQVHFDAISGFLSKGDVKLWLYESPTLASAGTPLDAFVSNLNFAATLTPTLSVSSILSVDVTDPGTFKTASFIPLTGSGANVSSASPTIGGGRVLKENTQYLIRIQNQDINASVDFGFNFNWHESDIILPGA